MQVHKTQRLSGVRLDTQKTRGDYLVYGDLLEENGAGSESPRFVPRRNYNSWTNRQVEAKI